MSSALPTLSVTVLNYNYGHFLPTCLDSVLGQTLQDMEVVIIDDCSTDASIDVIEPYLADDRVRLIRHDPNRGAIASLLEGCEVSRGRYITVVSADDWIVAPDAFERQVAMLEQEPSAVFAATSFGVYADETALLGVIEPLPDTVVLPGYRFTAQFLLGRALHHSGTIIRRSAYEGSGGYNPDARRSFDSQMWVRLAEFGDVAFIAEPLHAYRQHGSNMTASTATGVETMRELLGMLDREHERLDVLQPGLFRRAERKVLSEWMVQYALEKGDLRTGWSYWWAAVRMRPVPAIFQRPTALLFARTLFGARGFRLLERLKGIGSVRTRRRLAQEGSG